MAAVPVGPVLDGPVIGDPVPGGCEDDPLPVSDCPVMLPGLSVGEPVVPVPGLTPPGCSVISVPGLSTPMPGLRASVSQGCPAPYQDLGGHGPVPDPGRPDGPLVPVPEVCAPATSASAHSAVITHTMALLSLLDMCVLLSQPALLSIAWLGTVAGLLRRCAQRVCQTTQEDSALQKEQFPCHLRQRRGNSPRAATTGVMRCSRRR